MSSDEKLKEKTPFSTREWIGLIFILMIIEAFIAYAAFVNAPNGSALNYVSFAGTLISIILAVLAIGYTYGESIKDKGKSDALEQQIKALRDINEKIKGQAEALDGIEAIKTNLGSIVDKVENGFNETKNYFSIFEGKLNLATGRVKSEKSNTQAHIVIPDFNKIEIIKSVLAAKHPLLEVSLLLIIYFSRVKGFTIESYDIEIDEHLKELIEEENKILNMSESYANIASEVIMGSFLSAASILKGLGLLDKNDCLSDEVVEQVKISVETEPSSAGFLYEALRNRLIKELNDIF